MPLLPSLRREPYRLFFPLALAVGWSGMFPWFAFGRGWTRTWPGMPHALTMTQGFLLALVIGFLGTMIPRRAQAAPLPAGALLGLAAATVLVPVFAFLGRFILAEGAYAAALLTLAAFMVRSFLRRADRRPAPPSFVLIPIGLAHGLAGAVLIAAYTAGAAAPWALSLGRQLAQLGLMLALVLAVVPMVGPILAAGVAPDDPPPRRLRALRAAHAVAGLALAASFLLEELVSAAAGLWLRAAVVTLVLVGPGRLLQPLAIPGLHRRLFRAALWFVIFGLAGAAVEPARRIPALHLVFVGGFSLLALAVSVHVTLVHGGREREARGRPLLVAVAAGLTLAAAIVRFLAEHAPRWYFQALTLASTLWLAAALAWAVYLVLRSRAQPFRHPEAPPHVLREVGPGIGRPPGTSVARRPPTNQALERREP